MQNWEPPSLRASSHACTAEGSPAQTLLREPDGWDSELSKEEKREVLKVRLRREEILCGAHATQVGEIDSTGLGDDV